MSKNNNSKIGKILSYILGVKPDEFSLIPDENGYVKIKELIKALHETSDLKWINKSKITSYGASHENTEIEVNDKLVRAVSREEITRFTIPKKIPGELYTCIKRKSWKHILEKGYFPENNEIILSQTRKKALVLGKRIDNNPVLLMVSGTIAEKNGVLFRQFGDIFIVEYLKKNMYKGPSLEKVLETLPVKKTVKEKPEITPGSFTPKIEDVFSNIPGKTDKGKKGTWKKNKKRLRKEKNKNWPDEF